MSERMPMMGRPSAPHRHRITCSETTLRSRPKRALILTGDPHAKEALPPLIIACGFEPVRLSAIGDLRTGGLDSAAVLLLCEESLPDGDFRDALRILNHSARKIPVIVFSQLADWDGYLRAMQAGAFDFLRYPFLSGELQRVLRLVVPGLHPVTSSLL